MPDRARRLVKKFRESKNFEKFDSSRNVSRKNFQLGS